MYSAIAKFFMIPFRFFRHVNLMGKACNGKWILKMDRIFVIMKKFLEQNIRPIAFALGEKGGRFLHWRRSSQCGRFLEYNDAYSFITVE
jgi:hypothetical protein